VGRKKVYLEFFDDWQRLSRGMRIGRILIRKSKLTIVGHPDQLFFFTRGSCFIHRKFDLLYSVENQGFGDKEYRPKIQEQRKVLP